MVLLFQAVQHQYPLHRISYCADDKAERRFFAFIAKNSEEEGHTCFVFVSDKLAEEITLTIGQAFDLAYRFAPNSFLSSNQNFVFKHSVNSFKTRITYTDYYNMKKRTKRVLGFSQLRCEKKMKEKMYLMLL